MPNLPAQEHVDKNNRITIDTAIVSSFSLSEHQVFFAGFTIVVLHLFLNSWVFSALAEPRNSLIEC
jgi:hypothetical protein